jgi:kumamolisin
MIPIPGTDLAARPRSRVIGRVDPDELVELTLRLRPTPQGDGAAGLEALALELGARKPADRKYLTPSEYETRFGASPDDVARVTAFATQNGFRVLRTHLAGRTVRISGPLGKLAAAFAVTLNLSSHDNHTYRERSGEISLPSDLDGVIEGVFGFDTRRMAEPQRRVSPLTQPPSVTRHP